MNLGSYETWAIIALLLGIFPAGAFVVLYSATYAWWSSRMGAHLMAMTSIIGVALLFTLINQVLHDYPGRTVISVLVLFGLAAALWHQLWILIDRIRNDIKMLNMDRKGQGNG